jgi:flagellar motor switch protein FliM
MPDGLNRIVKYDVFGTSHSPQYKSMLMEAMAGRIMRDIEFGLQQQTRHHVRLQEFEGSVAKHESSMKRLSPMLLAGIADLSPLRGRAILAIDGDLLGAIVDAMCGATEPVPFERTELATMEIRIGRKVLELVNVQVCKALAPLMKLNLMPQSYETGTGMLAIADSQDWMIEVVGKFETDIGRGCVTLVIPYSSFEPLEQKFLAQSGMIGNKKVDDAWVTGIARIAETVPIKLQVEIARAVVPVSIINNLRPGQILPFFIFSEAIVSGGGAELFRAEFGTFEGYLACRVRPEAIIEGDVVMSGGAVDGDLSEGIGPSRVELEKLTNTPEPTIVMMPRNVLDRVKVTLSVELGRTDMPVSKLKSIRHGEIVPLDQLVGEPMAIYANGQKIAYGEAVQISDTNKVGIRVLQLAEENGQKVDEIV